MVTKFSNSRPYKGRNISTGGERKLFANDFHITKRKLSPILFLQFQKKTHWVSAQKWWIGETAAAAAAAAEWSNDVVDN